MGNGLNNVGIGRKKVDWLNYERNNSFLLYSLQTFFNFMLPAARSALLIYRAFCWQIAIQRIQEIQHCVSVLDGFVGSIAPTGHFLAQSPHCVQDFPV